MIHRVSMIDAGWNPLAFHYDTGLDVSERWWVLDLLTTGEKALQLAGKGKLELYNWNLEISIKITTFWRVNKSFIRTVYTSFCSIMLVRNEIEIPEIFIPFEVAHVNSKYIIDDLK